MTIGSGIAIFGIWAAVAAIAWQNTAAAILIGFFALFATIAIATR